MRQEPFSFDNAQGERLSGILHDPGCDAKGWALFAHCFTCSKASLAASRIAKNLQARDYGVLRFDFTGLGDSEGEFGRGLSADASDLICAARAMQGSGRPPSLLIGHSLGGAAAVAAAGQTHSIKAVALIAAPFQADHVLKHLPDAFTENPANGDDAEPVTIAGRKFYLRPSFAQDLRNQDQEQRLKRLRMPLLLFHAPGDEVVSVDNAEKIFKAARHPKSYVSLGEADHLLSREEDARFVASVLADWTDHYLGPDAARETGESGGQGDCVRIVERDHAFRVMAGARGHRIHLDEPESAGGSDTAPTPYEHLAAAFGACTAMTCRMYASRKNWPLDDIVVDIHHSRESAGDRFVRTLHFEGDLTGDQRQTLLEIAQKCPVHTTLSNAAEIETLAGDPGNAPGMDADEHARTMEKACEATGERQP